MKGPRWLKPLIIGSVVVLFHKAAVLAAELPPTPARTTPATPAATDTAGAGAIELSLLPPPFPVGLMPDLRLPPRENPERRVGREGSSRAPSEVAAPASDDEVHPAQPLGKIDAPASVSRDGLSAGLAVPGDFAEPPTQVAQAPAVQNRKRLVFAGVAAGGLELIDRAAAATQALETALKVHYEVLRLEDLPSEQGIPAPKYYKDCPDAEGCLGVLAQRAQASMAVLGMLQLQEEPDAPVRRSDTSERVIVELTLLDLRHFEPSSTVQIEMLGADFSLLQESALLGIRKLEKRWKLLEAGPSPKPEPAARVSLAEEQLPQKVSPSPLLTLPQGRRGQLAMRVSAGAGYGVLGQEYISHRLVELADQPDTTVAEYSRLTLTPSSASQLGVGVSFGLTSRLELEARTKFSFGEGSVSAELLQEDDYANVSPWTFGACEGGGEACPPVQRVTAATFSVGMMGRLVLTPRALTSPVLLAGANLNLHADVVRRVQLQDYDARAWWTVFPPIRSVDVVAGVGLQRVLSRRALFVMQLPVTYQVQTTQTEQYEVSFSTPDHPSFSDAPPTRLQGLPLGVGLELGLQWELN